MGKKKVDFTTLFFTGAVTLLIVWWLYYTYEFGVRFFISMAFFGSLSYYILNHKKGRKIQRWSKFPALFLILYRKKWGLTLMDALARKAGPFFKFTGTIGIITGFLGMISIGFMLVKSLFSIFLEPEAPAAVGLVLPFKAKGIFTVPIEYFIISIFIIALIHELSHGILARVHKIKVKSSGFAFLGFGFPIIPAAFVEPEEKVLMKRPLKQQLHVFAAGPFSNIVLGFLCLGVLSFILLPFANGFVEENGVEIVDFQEGDFPAQKEGIEIGEVITAVNDVETLSSEELKVELEKRSPGNVVKLTTDKGEYNLRLAKNPEDETKPYLGVYLSQSTDLRPGTVEQYGSFFPKAVMWLGGLFVFLFALNIGIGLFNLLPIGPLDGGRMMHAVLFSYFEKDKALRLFGSISMVFFIIVMTNIVFAFIKP